MTHFPQPHPKERSTRIEFHNMLPAAIRLEDGRRRLGELQKVSLTGGLLRLPKPHVPGMLVEVIFMPPSGPVLGLAELLNPASPTLRCLQPFKFIMIDDDDYRRLSTLIECGAGAPSAGSGQALARETPATFTGSQPAGGL